MAAIKPRWQTVRYRGRTITYAVGMVNGRRIVVIKRPNA